MLRKRLMKSNMYVIHDMEKVLDAIFDERMRDWEREAGNKPPKPTISILQFSRRLKLARSNGEIE